MGGGGEAQAAVGSDGRRWEGTSSKREEMGGGGEAQAAVGSDGRRWGGASSGRK